MHAILRHVLLAGLLALLAAGLVACGGDDATEQDATTLLEETFSGDKDVKSGELDLKIDLNVQGGGAGAPQGPISVKLSGPFESQGEKKLPKFAMSLDFSGAGQSLKAGATSTGEAGFVNFQGQDYALGDEVFQQFRQGYEQAAEQSTEGDESPSLQSLGLDPRAWLTNPTNAGEAKVGDTDTIKITGGVDVPKLLDDVNEALGKAGQLGLQDQADLPESLTDEQKAQVAEALKDISVEIYTGADDKILRRLVVDMTIDAAEEGTGELKLDLSLLELNEGQDIPEPESTKPLEELLGQLGGLGGLLGGAGGGADPGAGGTGGGADPGAGGTGGSQPNSEQLQEYTDCIEAAGSDLEKAQQCAELITP